MVNAVSYAERLQKARARQGRLTDEEYDALQGDILSVLQPGRKYAMSTSGIIHLLVKFLGWERRKLDGPRDYLTYPLEQLEWTHKLIRSEALVAGETVFSIYWRENWNDTD